MIRTALAGTQLGCTGHLLFLRKQACGLYVLLYEAPYF